MQPSKSMLDYLTELNRLFPKPSENDIPTPFTPSRTPQSPFNQWTPNYSSSSTDSYSPEAFPELVYNRSDVQRFPETSRPFSENTSIIATPFQITRRPIVGRKIMGNSDLKPIEQSPVFTDRVDPPQMRNEAQMSPIKQWNEPQTPPNTNANTNIYELFPGENRGFEFRTPIKNPTVYPNISPSTPISQTSPVPANLGLFTPPQYRSPLNLGANSPIRGANLSMSRMGSPMPMTRTSSMSGVSTPMNLRATSSRFEDGVQKMCTFCRKNGETPLVYMTHAVKEKRGNRNIVTCPILRSHVCSTCGVSGDNAHTITYCPVLRSGNNGVPLKSTTITLKNTRIKSNGRRRY